MSVSITDENMANYRTVKTVEKLQMCAKLKSCKTGICTYKKAESRAVTASNNKK